MSKLQEDLEVKDRPKSFEEASQSMAAPEISLKPNVQPAATKAAAMHPLPKISRVGPALASIGLAFVGIAIVVAGWHLAASARPELPSPAETFTELKTLLADPLLNTGTSKGIFLQLASSLQKVFVGFGVAALVGIPLGFATGAITSARRAANPIVQILRPVSPLAWFPIALVLLKDARWASMLTIAITALWPTLINTAAGVAAVPQDHRNVAKVFCFSKLKYIRHVLLPYSTASIITGLRLSMGISWMVIVATEMLSGGTGIGFFVWDSYNNNNLPAVVAAIVFIGAIGFILDTAFGRLARSFDYSGTAA